MVRRRRPYSRLAPADLFPKQIEIWNVKGDVVRALATLPLAENVPARGVRAGPRALSWQPSAPASLVWVEALDGGDPRTKVAQQDRLVRLAAPLCRDPAELARLEKPFGGLQSDAQGLGLLTQVDRHRPRTQTVVL